MESARADAARGVAEVRTEAAASATQLADKVEALRVDLDRRMEGLDKRVAARLAADREADHAAVAALRTSPTRQDFYDAFDRAHRLGLVGHNRPPRVNVSRTSHLYVAVELDADEMADEPLMLRVETMRGVVHDWIPWLEDRGSEDVLVDVGRALFKHTGEALDPSALLGGLADLLEAAMSHPERRPAIQLCPPQWMVCDWGVTTYDTHVYGVNPEHLQSSNTITTHVPGTKGWVDPDSWDSAVEAALALFPPEVGTTPGPTQMTHHRSDVQPDLPRLSGREAIQARPLRSWLSR